MGERFKSWLMSTATRIWETIRERSSRRRCLIGLAAVLVCLYAFSVLGYAVSVPDVGLRTAFTTVISLAYPEFLKYPEGLTPTDVEGKRVVRLADHSVDNWPEWLRALHQTRNESGPTEEVESLPGPESGTGHVRFRGEELVRIQLRDADGRLSTIWCRLGHLPPLVLLPSTLWFILQAGLFLIAAFVFWKRPDDEAAAQFFLLSIFTVGAYMGGYHWSRIVSQPLLMLVFIVSSVMLPALGLHFYLIFPRPKALFERWRRWMLLTIYAPPLLFLITFVLGYFGVRWLLSQIMTQAEKVALMERVLEAVRIEVYVCLTVATLWGLAGLICLAHSYFTARDATERNQVKWILYGFLAALVPIGYALGLAFFQPYDFGGTGLTWPMFAASACVTIAFTVSITRYKLMQLDQMITSGAGYFLLSSLAGLVYYGVVFIGTILFSQWIAGPSFGQALGVAGAALVLLLVLDWLRSRIKKVLDRRFSRDKNHLDRTLQRMSQALEQLVDPPTLARRLLQESADLLGVQRGAVYLREGQDVLVYRLAHSLGEPPELPELSPGCPIIEALKGGATLLLRSRTVPPTEEPCQRQLRLLGGEIAQGLNHEGQMLALLVLGPREDNPYRPEDVNILAAFAQVTVLALVSAEGRHAVDALSRDLQEKVDKIAEQQRRILALQNQLRDRRSRGDERGSKPEMDLPSPNLERPIIGSSPQVRQLLHLVRKAAESQATVLIRGESGTGKELLARALHEQSPRADKPFVRVHCAALSPGLLESELFGHVKGAFTGAHRDKIGRFELAHGGTLFLDEIGDITLETQLKLLRVLQERTFERVGSTESLTVDVRVLTATHQELEKLIREGRFREDLFYRLNVISIRAPSLRERCEDIPELVQHFLQHCGQRSGRRSLTIDDDAMLVLKNFAWPGNIRQLENAMERAVVSAEGTLVTLADLPPEIVDSDPWTGDREEKLPVSSLPTAQAEREDRDRREREQLVRALAATNGNKAEAARALGLARSTLVSRLKKHGLS